MIIYSLKGKALYRSVQRTARAALEEGVTRNTDFSGADLRRFKLSGASLDGLKAKGACLWGAELDGADIGLADLRGTDMRCVNLKDTCLAESDLSGSDLRGAYFSGTIMSGTLLDGLRVSCPSFWSVDLGTARSVQNATYFHKGEVESLISQNMRSVKGPLGTIVFNEGDCFWRGELYKAGSKLPSSLLAEMRAIQQAMALIARPDMHNATNPNPKRKNTLGGL